MFTHTQILSWTSANGTLTSNVQASADAETALRIEVPHEATNLLVAFALDISECKALCFLSNKAITIKTNDPVTPDDTIALAPNVPWTWITGGYVAAPPLSADITALYIDNEGTTEDDDATLEIRCLYDSTVGT